MPAPATDRLLKQCPALLSKGASLDCSGHAAAGAAEATVLLPLPCHGCCKAVKSRPPPFSSVAVKSSLQLGSVRTSLDPLDPLASFLLARSPEGLSFGQVLQVLQVLQVRHPA